MFKVLVKKQLAEIFKGYFYDAKRNRMRSKGAIVAWFAFFIVLIVGLFGGMFTALSLSLCGGLSQADAGWLYFAVMGAIAILMGTFGAVFNSYAALYLARDNDLLLSLPIPARDIIASRLASVYLLGLLYSAVTLIPALVVYWVLVRPGAVAVICGIVLLLIVSAIVLSLSCLLGWVVARISRKLRNKGIIIVIIALVCFALYFAGYALAGQMIQSLVVSVTTHGARADGLARIVYAFGSVGEGNVMSTMLCLAVAAALFALTWWIMLRSYLSIVTATGASEKIRYVERRAKQKTPFKALFGKELTKFKSSPNYMMNTGIGIVFMVIAGVVVLINAEAINGLIAKAGGGNSGLVCVLACGVLCLCATANDIVAPSVSLEGKSIWVLQSLPMEAKVVLRAKAAVHFVLTVVPLAFAVACVAISLDVPVVSKALMCIVPFACVALSTMAGSFFGVKMANLAWTNELMPIKQGAAVGFTLFGCWGVIVVFVGLYFLVGRFIDVTAYLAIWAVLFVAVAVWLLHWLDTEGARLFADL